MRVQSLVLLAVLGCTATASRSEAPITSIVRLEDRREFGPELLTVLVSSEALVRARAALAAGRIGDAAAIEPLAGLLRDADAAVRASAAFALGEIEDSLAAEPLALLLQAGDEIAPHVRALAIEGLGKLQSRRHAALCVASLNDAAQEVLEAACLASWQMQAAEAAPRLIELAANEDATLRWKATYALMRMLGAPVSGRTAIPGGTDLDGATRGRIRNLLYMRAFDSDARIRMTTLRGLSNFDDPATAASLTASFTDGDWRVRVQAIRGMVAIENRREEGSTGSKIGVVALLPLLEDTNPNVRLTAIDALGVLGEADPAEKLLREKLNDENERFRQVAALALTRRYAAREDHESILRLAHTMAESEAWSMRATAAQILDEGETPDTTLYARLLRDDPRVAKLAIEPYLTGLAERQPSGVTILEHLSADLDRLLSAPDPVLRALTLDATGRILGDSLDAEVQAAWLARLQTAWERAQDDRENDVRTTVVERVTPFADDPTAAAILDAARSRQEDPGRTIEEYQAILDWAEEAHDVEIITAHGPIRITLFAHDAPLTCWNFTRLAEAGFYDRGNWHRIVPDFVAQDGCPRGDGWGGPGHTIRCEINEHRYETGTVGMALSGKDTGGSQFFITHSPQPHLDGRYTVFGQVSEGMDVVDRLVQGDRIESIRLLEDRGSPR